MNGIPPPPPHSDGSHALSELDPAHVAAATANAALSQNPPLSSTTSQVNGKKRKASGQPGSRGVANLTPEQLAKKRANDREAQRAIRERTRLHTESLEARIRELQSQQPYQELQRVIRERDRALAECEDLRRRLGAVAGIAGGQHPSLNELAALTAQQSPLPAVASQAPAPAYDGQAVSLGASHSTVYHSPSNQESTPSHPYQNPQAVARRWSPSPDQHPTGAYPADSAYHFDQHRPHAAAASGMHPSNGERHDLSYVLERSHPGSRSTESPSTPAYQRTKLQEGPIWIQLPMPGPSTCTLDKLLNDFHTSRRNMLREGASRLETIGPMHPSFSALMNPEALAGCHPVSALIIDMISKFPDINTVPERVAVVYNMFLYMRWLICPCQECFERLPEYIRPVEAQFNNPHAVWSDYVPWPHMRKSLAEHTINFDEFFVPYTETLSVNWHPSNGPTLYHTTAAADKHSELAIHPDFEAHIRNLRNWSIGPAFRQQFRHLVDETVRVVEA